MRAYNSPFRLKGAMDVINNEESDIRRYNMTPQSAKASSHEDVLDTRSNKPRPFHRRHKSAGAENYYRNIIDETNKYGLGQESAPLRVSYKQRIKLGSDTIVEGSEYVVWARVWVSSLPTDSGDLDFYLVITPISFHGPEYLGEAPSGYPFINSTSSLWYRISRSSPVLSRYSIDIDAGRVRVSGLSYELTIDPVEQSHNPENILRVQVLRETISIWCIVNYDKSILQLLLAGAMYLQDKDNKSVILASNKILEDIDMKMYCVSLSPETQLPPFFCIIADLLKENINFPSPKLIDLSEDESASSITLACKVGLKGLNEELIRYRKVQFWISLYAVPTNYVYNALLPGMLQLSANSISDTVLQMASSFRYYCSVILLHIMEIFESSPDRFRVPIEFKNDVLSGRNDDLFIESDSVMKFFIDHEDETADTAEQ